MAGLTAAAAAGTVSAQQPASEPATTLAPLTVHGSGVPMPGVGQGAPNYTPDELHQQGYNARSDRATFQDALDMDGFSCPPPSLKPPPAQWKEVFQDAADASRRVSDWSRVAETATIKAQQVRVDAASGTATQAQVDQAELDRQKAVIEVVKAQQDLDENKDKLIDIQDLVFEQMDVAGWQGVLMTNAAERASRKYKLVPKEFEDLKLENIKVYERHDNKGEPYLFVTGAIHNTHAKRIAVPPLSLTAVDQFGYPLLVQEGEARGRIDPGKSQAFTYSLNPSPDRTARVVVTFAGLKRPGRLEPAQCLPGNFPDTSGGDPFYRSSSSHSMQLNAR